jgi:8-oxo-dGTP diphosphatase
MKKTSHLRGLFVWYTISMNKVSHDSETLVQGQQVFTACAFIHRVIDGEEKVFLPKRADTKKFLPGKYELPGGHIDYGEEIKTGLKREVKEELGIGVALGDPFAVFTYTNKVKGSHSIEVVYFAQVIGSPDAITIDPDDHSTCGWFSENEAVALNDDENDAEVTVIKRGFALLRGDAPLF